MPMSSRCMGPYWLFENHPEIGLSLSINLSHMKAIKNTKTKKESRVRTPIISLDLITNYLNNTNNTTKPPTTPTNHGWVNGGCPQNHTRPTKHNQLQPGRSAERPHPGVSSIGVLDMLTKKCFCFVVFIYLFTYVNMYIYSYIYFLCIRV